MTFGGATHKQGHYPSPFVSSPSPHRFLADDGQDLEPLLAALADRLHLVAEAPVRTSRTLYDTFDWRLWAKGSVLERRRPAGRHSRSAPALPPDALGVVWRSLDGDVLGRLDVDDVPAFAWDLPPGPVADRLADLLDMRAVQPLVTIEATTATFRLLDDEDKTVSRLVVERAKVGRAALPITVDVLTMRGYEREASNLADVLAAQVVLRPGTDDLAAHALRVAGRTPGDYSSKLRLALDPRRTAADTFTTVLRTLLDAVEANEVGTRADTDSEFLHDYRVAVRRTRSVLGQARRVLPPVPLARFRDDFAWLGGVTSPTRDLDVWLLTVPELVAMVAEPLREDLEPLTVLLAEHQRTEHRRLVRALDTERYRTLHHDYAAWLADPGFGAADLDPDDVPDANRPATEVAGARITKAFKRVVRDGRAIAPSTPAEALHELRKDAKKLRYALECFGSLFDPAEVAPLVKDLKSLQDVLGEFQDCEVQAGSLRGYADELAQRDVGAGPLLALGAVVEQLAERQDDARAAFHERFESFDTYANRHRVKTVFSARPAPSSGGSP